MKPHVGWLPEWRSQEIIDYWETKCPIKHLVHYLTSNNISSSDELEIIKKKVDQEIDDAFGSIQNEPIATVEDMLTHVYEEGSVN